MILTISLLCSGREKTTEKCLKSIRFIADEIGDSEIIIIDTGCDSQTLDIVNKYADSVIPFTWCDDFAAARNVGIDVAKGEWFMFIDDDEWFEDPAPIVNFFKDKTYVNYTSATYIVRNYKDLNGYAFVDSINQRLVKLVDKKINRFTGRIHESFVYLGESEYNITCHAEHYGYAYRDDQQRIAHCRRNITLLCQMLEEDPDNLRWPSHLVSEYYTAQEYSKLIELCTNTLSKIQYSDTKEFNYYRPLFYCANVYAHFYKCDYEVARKLCSDYLDDSHISNIATLRLLELHIRMCYFSNKDWNEILQIVQKFDSLYPTIDQAQAIIDNPLFQIKEAFDATYVNEIYIYGTIAAIYSSSPSMAFQYFDKIMWSDGDKAIFISPDILDIFDAISCVPFAAPLQKIIEQLINKSVSRELAEKRITKLIYADSNSESLFARYASNIDSNSTCIKRLSVINSLNSPEQTDVNNLLIKYFSSSADFFSDSQIWDIISEQKINFETILASVPFNNFTKAASSYVAQISIDEIFLSLKKFNNCFSIDDRKFDFLQLKLYEGIMLKTPAESWNEFDELIEAISLWTQVSIGYYSNYISPNSMRIDCPLVNDVAAISFELNHFLSLATTDFRSAFASIKTCIGVCPPLDNTLVRLTRLYADFYKNALN